MKASAITEQSDQEPSKSERKRQHKALQEFTAALVAAPESQLTRVGLPEEVLDEIRSARKMSKAALKRQVGFISKRMDRELAAELITDAQRTFEAFKHPSAAANAHFHQLENWRNRLLEGDTELLEEIVSATGADRQQLRRMMGEADKQRQQGKPPVASRQLFQYLRKLSEAD